jgi:hypothetical protein
MSDQKSSCGRFSRRTPRPWRGWTAGAAGFVPRQIRQKGMGAPGADRLIDVSSCSIRMLKKFRSHGLPDRKAGNPSACARPFASWQGPSPLPQRHAASRPAGGQKAPDQRPPRPWRALACGVPGPADLRGAFPRRRGNAVRFRVPPKGAIAFPGSGRASRQAGDRIAFQHPAKPRSEGG